MNRDASRKNVIIVGAGLAGLTAGISCLQHGFSVDLYEKNPIAGGEATSWTRKGMEIDGCAHWIIGTAPGSDLYPLWQNVGIIDPKVKSFPMEELSAFRIGDRLFHFYSDLDKLKAEMFAFFPEDKRLISTYIRGVKAYRHVRIPVNKPLDRMNLFDLIAFGLPMLPMAFAYAKYTRISVGEFASRAKNPNLRDLFLRWLPSYYCMHAMLYVHQSASLGDACVYEGGSKAMMERVVARFQSLGGRLHLSSPVAKVLIEGHLASGIELIDGTCVKGDSIVLATDAHYAFETLLAGKYQEKFFSTRFADEKNYPLNCGLFASFRIHKDMKSFPKMYDFPCHIEWEGETWENLAIRNYSFDPSFVSEEGTLLTSLLLSSSVLFDRLKAKDKEEYKKAKAALLEALQQEIAKELKLKAEDVEILDLATPLTYERYCHAYKGSYMAFRTTKHMGKLMHNGRLKGVDNLFLAGQWIMPPGGLPVALFTGQNAAWNVCNYEKTPL